MSTYTGKAQVKLRALHKPTLEGAVVALDLTRASRVCEQVEAALRVVSERHGLEKKFMY
ncbi:hypothetical protein SAMN05216330_1329 [Bradyrhizobium sp. Ghvi]|uniref:hypothetical protein n=1 Tax=Bradyrhizobium sp. Ghvi TaxID=1855319 RepID=UPI0008F3E94D|nr:hypothetical protein [Bradyrhizobium sp. Ghvi]SFQ35955.1 hypothetical protein SAMN05216330_1329 [Bradyrhizobium sp. Ghvi]